MDLDPAFKGQVLVRGIRPGATASPALPAEVGSSRFLFSSLALQRPGRSYRPTSRPTAKSRFLSLLQLQIFFSKESFLD
jgi:hypothetical protein